MVATPAALVESSLEVVRRPALVPDSRASEPREPADETEAFQVLLARAEKRTGTIPPDVLVRHILSVTRGADWPVQRDALEALLRRYSFGNKDKLAVESRPGGDRIWGLYSTSRRGSSTRPYSTLLESIDPPRGSCDCPDFLRSSLGLCKHLLAVIESWTSKPRKLAMALRAEGSNRPRTAPRLRWDPVRPLTGFGDWLERVRWMDADVITLTASDAGWFQRDEAGHLLVREGHARNPARRRALVRALLDILGRLRQKGSGADPALRALLLAERERLEKAAPGPLGRELDAALRSLKLKLYPYQKDGVASFLAAKRLLLADDMGLGKTAQAIAACHALWRTGRIRRGLLIVPASLKPQWLREWQLFTDVPAEIVEGHPAERAKVYRSTKEGFLISNYEQLLRDLEIMHGWRPDLVVLDEAQRMKNWATKTAVYVKKLDPPYRLVLTGTPMENRLEELASILEWVDDLALEPKWRLVPWYAVYVDGKKEIGGARNLDTLRARLAPCTVRRVRQEVLSQLPARTDIRHPVAMTPIQLEEHGALDQPILKLMSTGRRRPLTQAEFLKLMSLFTLQRIISNGMAQYRFDEVWPGLPRVEKTSDFMFESLSSPKLVELRDLVSRIVVEQGRKAVVFSQWVRMLRLADWAVGDILSAKGLRSVFFTGNEGQRRRTQNIVDFHDDPSVRILFASDAGGVGLNLQRAANCVINIEQPWNPAVLEQRIGRIYRIGQKHPIDVYNLVCETGIEARIYNLVRAKHALFKGLFDGSSDTATFETSGSFLSKLEKLVNPIDVPELPKARQDDEAEAESSEDLDLAIGGLSGQDPTADTPLLPGPAELVAERPSGEATAESPPLPAPGDIRKLLSEVKVHRGPEGGLTIEAPPEAASTLAALFQSLAGMLHDAAARS